jgi:hypothetical protein
MTCPARDHAPTMRRERLQIFPVRETKLAAWQSRPPSNPFSDDPDPARGQGRAGLRCWSVSQLVALPFEFDELTDIAAHESGSAFFRIIAARKFSCTFGTSALQRPISQFQPLHIFSRFHFTSRGRLPRSASYHARPPVSNIS